MSSRLSLSAALILTAILCVGCTGSEDTAPGGGPGGGSVTGDAERGQQIIAQYGCNVCHITPGVSGPQGRIGPSFEKIATRRRISDGTVENTPENLVRFIQRPASLNPRTRMPPMDVSPVDAQDMAAYLLTLR